MALCGVGWILILGDKGTLNNDNWSMYVLVPQAFHGFTHLPTASSSVDFDKTNPPTPH